MTKTLTEQWREGTLPEGYHYTKLNDDNGTIEINYCCDDGCFQDYCDNMVKEVLAPVPSYDKVKEMSQKIERLEFDNEALEMIRNELVQKVHILNEQNTKQYNELCEEINKNNILKKQLKEANEVIKEYDSYTYTLEPSGKIVCREANNAHFYLEKWGVK